MSGYVVVGTQWGDEGKGKVVDLLGTHVDMVVRFQGGSNAGLDTCWYNPNHAENPGKVCPTYEISNLEEPYQLVMEPEELANVGLKNRRHQL